MTVRTVRRCEEQGRSCMASSPGPIMKFSGLHQVGVMSVCSAFWELGSMSANQKSDFLWFAVIVGVREPPLSTAFQPVFHLIRACSLFFVPVCPVWYCSARCSTLAFCSCPVSHTKSRVSCLSHVLHRHPAAYSSSHTVRPVLAVWIVKAHCFVLQSAVTADASLSSRFPTRPAYPPSSPFPHLPLLSSLPTLSPSALPEGPQSLAAPEHSAKMLILMSIVQEAARRGEKVVVFSRLLHSLSYIQEVLEGMHSKGHGEHGQHI